MKTALVPLYITAELRAVERAALALVPPGTLMSRAGLAAADLAMRILGSAARKRVLVLAGPGNNGGDAFIAATRLAECGALTSVIPLFDDARPLPADAERARDACRQSQARFIAADPAHCACDDWDLVIDGLFGIGLARNLDDRVRSAIAAVNRLHCPVLALDIPTGLNADTGTVVDDQGIAVVATHTITFLGDKPGLHTGAGRDHAGEVVIADLGITEKLLPRPTLHLSGIPAFQAALRRREHVSHKGSHGSVAVVGGAAGMTGGAMLAARAALFAGAGRVYAALLDRSTAYDTAHPEIMLRDAGGFEPKDATIVAGPGMGTGQASRDLLERVLASAAPAVLDADALNLVGSDTEMQARVPQRAGNVVITPHPLEAGRLLHCTVGEVQANRIEAARELARRFHCVAVLKGSGTVIAAPDGAAVINPTGNAALATGGTGDVLAGLCGALLAQGYTAWQAAIAGVWLHGAAADQLVQDGTGPIGVTASELVVPIRDLLNRITSRYAD